MGCYQGHDFIGWHRVANVENSFIGAERCAVRCTQGGFKYWGLECPSQNVVNCHCGDEGMLDSLIPFPDQKCKEYNDDRSLGLNSQIAHWCVGPYNSSMNGVEYFHGSGYIASAYLTNSSGN